MKSQKKKTKEKKKTHIFRFLMLVWEAEMNVMDLDVRDSYTRPEIYMHSGNWEASRIFRFYLNIGKGVECLNTNPKAPISLI